MIGKCGTGSWWVLAGLVLSLSATLPGHAEEPDAHLRDVRQTMQARRLLLTEPRIAELNLGVRVVDRVATLWGPVPAAGFGQLAETRLRQMIELVEVRNELYVDPLDPESTGPAFLPPSYTPTVPEAPQGPGFPDGAPRPDSLSSDSRSERT